jgi:hypothetical protein
MATSAYVSLLLQTCIRYKLSYVWVPTFGNRIVKGKFYGKLISIPCIVPIIVNHISFHSIKNTEKSKYKNNISGYVTFRPNNYDFNLCLQKYLLLTKILKK